MIALGLGDAGCVWEDAEAARRLFEPEVVAATNNIASVWPGHVDHWFTLHPRAVPQWVGIELALSRRLKLGLNRPHTWSHKPDKGIDFVTPDWGGSTGLLLVKGLLEIGLEKIVLAGIPMTRAGRHYYEAEDWAQAEHYHKAWTKHLDLIRPHVRSMSGWTRDILGAPTPEWLEPSR